MDHRRRGDEPLVLRLCLRPDRLTVVSQSHVNVVPSPAPWLFSGRPLTSALTPELLVQAELFELKDLQPGFVFQSTKRSCWENPAARSACLSFLCRCLAAGTRVS